MKRTIFSLPEGTTLEALTDEQQAAIASVFAQFVLPMPGTQSHDGLVLVDGVTADNFDPAVMPALGLDWTCLYLAQWDGKAPTATTLTPLDMDAIYPYLTPTPVYDDEGNQTGTQPPERRLPHNWAGWPQP